MNALWRIVWFAFIIMVVFGCRNDTSITTSGSGQSGQPPTFTQRLSFSVTGLSGSLRMYTKFSAAYHLSTNETTIETLDDSSTAGKFYMRIRGGSAGSFRYEVTGSPADVNQVYIRFVSSYNGSTPSAVFELTGVPEDSLEAVVNVQHFGTVRDSITGTLSAKLKLTSPAMKFTIILHSGTFSVQRLQ